MSDDEHRLAAVQVGDLLELRPVAVHHLGAGLAPLEAGIERPAYHWSETASIRRQSKASPISAR